MVGLNRESGGNVASLNPESVGCALNPESVGCDVSKVMNSGSYGDVPNFMLTMASGTLRRCQPIMMSGPSRRCQEIGSLCWLDARANTPFFL